MPPRTLLIVPTPRLLTEHSDHAQWLADKAGLGIAFVLDVHMLPMTAKILRLLRVLNVPAAVSRCADYALYYARHALPNYEFYWFLDSDVYVNIDNPADFFAPFHARPEWDFLAPEFGPASQHWPGCQAMAPFVPAVHRCLFSLVRCSRSAIDVFLAERQRLYNVFDTKWHDATTWPSDAAFCASIAMQNRLQAADLNVVSTCYSRASLLLGQPTSLKRISRSAKDGLIYQPVAKGAEFLAVSHRALRAAASCDAAEILRDAAFVADLQEECGAATADRFLMEMRQQIADRLAAEAQTVLPSDMFAEFDGISNESEVALSDMEFDAAAVRFGTAVKTRILRPAQLHPYQPPAFFHGHEPDSMRPMLSMDLFQVACRTLHGVCVGAESSIVREGVVILGEECGLAASWTHVRALERPRAAWLRPTQYCAQAVLLTGPGHYIFGHWLVDFLPRLFVLYRAGYELRALKYLLPSDTPPFVFALLELAGIPRGAVVLYDRQTDVVAVDELIVPNNLRTHSRMHPDIRLAGAFLTGLFLGTSGLPAARAERIFVIRRGSASVERRLLNRAEIEGIAAGAGFVLVDPAELTLPNQVALFASARCIIGEYGSAMHLALFSAPGTVVCCLRGNGPHPGWVQSSLAQELEHKIGYVIGPLEPDGGSFRVDESQFRAALSDAQSLAGLVPPSAES